MTPTRGFGTGGARAILAGALMCLAAGQASAAPMTAAELTAACTGDANARLTCDGYLRALTDFVLVRAAQGKNGKVCLPKTIAVEQVRDAVTKFAAAKPPKGDPTAIRLVSAAMRAKYPCGGAPRTP